MISGNTLSDSNSDNIQDEPDLAAIEKEDFSGLSSGPAPASDVYILRKAFEDLKILIDQFDVTDAKQPVKKSSSADGRAFSVCKKAIDQFYSKGLRAQNVSWDVITNIPKIIIAALSAVRTLESTFKNKKAKPKTDLKSVEYCNKSLVTGVKSADYCNKVLIPFLRCLGRVQFEDWLITICSYRIVNRNLEKEKAIILILADQYAALTATIIPAVKRDSASNAATLAVVGQFAVGTANQVPLPANDNNSIETIKPTNTG